MNRYVFYHYLIVCFSNLMILVPYHLMAERFDGSVMAIFLSPIFGVIMLYLFTAGLSKFPNQGLPEILSHFYPRWLVGAVVTYKALIVGMSSTLVIASYAIVITRFLNPEGNPYVILTILMLVCAFGATRSTVTVNFVLEIVVILCIPAIAFIMYKTINNPFLKWDAVQIVLNHYNRMPSLLAFASATFVFTGFLNLGLFNRILPPNFRFKYRWTFPLIAFVVQFITFFVPIGIHGTEGVANYVYVWSATADSARMIFGFIERMLFIFLIVLINLSLAFTMVGWHMVIEYIRTLFPNNKVDPDEPKPPRRSYWIVAVLVVLTLIFMYVTNELNVIYIGGIFLIIRMISEIVITLWVYALSKKKVRKYEKKISV